MTVRATLAVDGDRLIANLNQLATIGALPNGGVRRLAFTPEDLQGRAQVQRWMLDAGMSTRIERDTMGEMEVPAARPARRSSSGHGLSYRHRACWRLL